MQPSSWTLLLILCVPLKPQRPHSLPLAAEAHMSSSVWPLHFSSPILFFISPLAHLKDISGIAFYNNNSNNTIKHQGRQIGSVG